MGTNKRYADAIDRRVRERTDQEAMRTLKPASLEQRELELHRLPLTRTPVALPVWAWVHYGSAAIRVDAEIVAWTSRACAIRWKTPDGFTHKAWVWASAVERKNT